MNSIILHQQSSVVKSKVFDAGEKQRRALLHHQFFFFSPLLLSFRPLLTQC